MKRKNEHKLQCLLIKRNIVIRLRLGCPGSLMSLYGPTFHVTPVDLCVIFQCNLYNYISSIKSCVNKIVSNCCKIVSKLFQIISNSKIIKKITKRGSEFKQK